MATGIEGDGWRWTLAAALAVAALLAGLVPPIQTAEAAARNPVMQPQRLTGNQMEAWFRSDPRRVANWNATVSPTTLLRYFVEEGKAEGVAADLAFAQSVLETAAFSFPPSGQVRREHNNFGGIGACDGGTCTVASFRSARIGVRAQIQHLRAYADPTVTPESLAYPLESPRFHLVSPKGRARYWDDMGGGNWATDPDYASKILRIYADMQRHAGVSIPPATAYVGPFRDVPVTRTHASAIEAIAVARFTTGCTRTAYCPGDPVSRQQLASLLVRAAEIPPTSQRTFVDVSGTHQPAVEALAASGHASGCAADRFCPHRSVTRAQVASLLRSVLDLPRRPAPFADVDPDSPHAGAIGALAHAGIVTGVTADRFRPNAPVSRGQLASILQRAFLR